jgi:hypothetical protein
MASTFFKIASGEFLSGWQPDAANSKLSPRSRLRNMKSFFIFFLLTQVPKFSRSYSFTKINLN